MSQVCSNDYAEPPDGIPVWCVDSSVNLESGIQLIGELLILALLWVIVAKIKRYLIRRKRQKEVAQTPLTHPADFYTLTHTPKKP